MGAQNRTCTRCKGTGWVTARGKKTRCPGGMPIAQISGTSRPLPVDVLKVDKKARSMPFMYQKVKEAESSHVLNELNNETANMVQAVRHGGESAAQKLENVHPHVSVTFTTSPPIVHFASVAENNAQGADNYEITNFPMPQRAELLARAAHYGQRDKLGVPYVMHVSGVFSILKTLPEYQKLSPTQQETAQCAAWLHDVLEDTTMTREQLHACGVNDETLTVIEALTFYENSSRDEYYERIKAAGAVAVAVKLADLGHNTLPARRAFLPGSPQIPAKSPKEDSYTRLGKKYAKAYTAFNAVMPAHLQPFA